MAERIAIILHAEPGTHDSLGRALHSLLYTKELNEKGFEARLIFDGGGTRWAGELSKEDHKLHELFESVKASGAIHGVCQFCVDAFGGSVDEVERAGLKVIGEYSGHPSVAGLIADGFKVITL
ncbi:MAG: DsrE family protein [Deltaproteobacteria bacterium]|nr:DsrE family protein [Deltaproteobacteria bacterium]